MHGSLKEVGIYLATFRIGTFDWILYFFTCCLSKDLGRYCRIRIASEKKLFIYSEIRISEYNYRKRKFFFKKVNFKR